VFSWSRLDDRASANLGHPPLLGAVVGYFLGSRQQKKASRLMKSNDVSDGNI
jgi:hypothetical protein